jgi:hypothetical protein
MRSKNPTYASALEGERAFMARHNPMATVRIIPLTDAQRKARVERIAKAGSTSRREWLENTTGTRRGTSL